MEAILRRAAGPFALVVAAGLVSCTLEGAAAEQERPSPAGLAVRSAPHINPSPQHLVIARGSTGTSRISWGGGVAESGKVTLSSNGGPEVLFARGTSGSALAKLPGGPGYFVFRFYQGTSLSAYSSVSVEDSNGKFGMNYWPYQQDNGFLSNARWPTIKAKVAADLDQMASLNVRVLRLMFWPLGSGFQLSPDPAQRFPAELTEEAQNFPEFLELARARGFRVIIAFSNSYYALGNGTLGDYFWMDKYATIAPFIADSCTWMNAFVTRVEASNSAQSVIYYDYENELDSSNPQTSAYFRGVYDCLAAPPGKRGVSVRNVPADSDALATAAAGRRLDYVDFHGYFNLNTDVNLARSQVQAKFPASTVLLGEFGWSAPAPSDELAQEQFDLRTFATATWNGFPYALNWMLWDQTPVPANQSYGFSYSWNEPKDVTGTFITTFGPLLNADFEIIGSDGKPTNWSAGGTASSVLTSVAAPTTPAPPTHARYARVSMKGSGQIWLTSDALPTSGGQTLYVNGYLHSNLDWNSIDVHEYDAAAHEITYTPGPHMTTSANIFRNYLSAVGSFSVALKPDTASVRIALAGGKTTTRKGLFYLDADTISVNLR